MLQRMQSYSPILYKRQSAPSVLSKLSRAGNTKDPIRKPACRLAFLIQGDILLLNGLRFE